MLGLYALDHLIERGVSGIPGPLKSKLKGAVATKMDAKGAAHKRELAKYAKEFSNYNKTADAIQARNAAYNTAFLKAELAKSASPLDYDQAEQFSGDMIEVGHTGLCLTKAGSWEIVEEDCVNAATQKWSTRPASGAPNTNPKATGYQFIYQTTGGACIAPEGAWTKVERKFSDPANPKAGSFTFLEPKFEGNGRITARGCVNSKEFYWKVLKHGDGWMQMASLATNQCLNFENSSAVPGQAVATWKPCTGASNQVYRVADSVTPKYYKANIALRNDSQSACFADPDAAGKINMVPCTRAARYNYSIDIRGYIKFINRATGNCLQPESYANGAKLVERTCSNLDYQWWNPAETPGGWRIQNGQTGKCTRTTGLGKVAEMGDCIDFSQNIIAPVTDPNSGITLNWKPPGARIANFNAAYPGTPAVGICAMGGMIGESLLTGSLMPNGVCWVSFGGPEFEDKGSRQQFVAVTDGLEWVESGGGKITEYALPTGFREGSQWGGWKGVKTAYACRTKFAGTETGGGQTTRVGWTIDGRTCQFAYFAGPGTTTFEVLARHPDKAYRLHLGDLKPVPKAGAHRPGPLALPEKLLGDLPKNLVPEPAVKAAKKEVKRAARHVRRFFHHRF